VNVEPVIAPDTALALFAATVLVGHSRDPVFARGYIGACRPGERAGRTRHNSCVRKRTPHPDPGGFSVTIHRGFYAVPNPQQVMAVRVVGVGV